MQPANSTTVTDDNSDEENLFLIVMTTYGLMGKVSRITETAANRDTLAVGTKYRALLTNFAFIPIVSQDNSAVTWYTT